MASLGGVSCKLGISVVPQVASEALLPNEPNSKLLPMASDLSVPAATASTAGRSKIALKPGRSLMDWIRLTHSGKDLTSVGGKCVEVSPRELAKHNTKKDAWICLRGRVYNITHYLEYHPGGEDELMRGAGKDATDLFNQVHQWVNAESMLEKCFVGYLKRTWTFDVPKLPNLKNLKFKTKPAVTPESPPELPVAPTDATCEDALIISNGTNCEVDAASLNAQSLPICTVESNGTTVNKLEWSVTSLANVDHSEELVRFEKSDEYIKVIISKSNEEHRGLITDLRDRKCFIKINYDSTYIFNVEFPDLVKEDYKVAIADKQTIAISFQPTDNSEPDGDSPSFIQRIHWTMCKPKDELVYWPCKLADKVPVNYNTFLFKFQLPSEVKMWVPIGQHIQVKSCVEGMEVVRSYTPVVSIPNLATKCSEDNDGSTISLIVKIYPKGAITPVIDQCNVGESILISNYVGSFSEKMLATCDSVTMLAAGTGITPMIKIIHWIMNASDRKRSMLLLFFNKKEEDILWRKELKSCCAVYDKFQIVNVLSEPDEQWSEPSGQIDEELLKKLLEVNSVQNRQNFFICGPLPFTETAIRCLEGAGYSSDQVYAFTGS